jgi:anti-sigma-K factor RskA
MKPELSHDEAFVSLDAAALEALDASELDAVLAHAARCAACREELQLLRDIAAQLAFAVPAADYHSVGRDRVRSRLVARATAMPSASARVINMLAWRRAEWMAVAASILMVVSIGLLASVLRDRENLKDSLKVEIAQGQRARTRGDSLRIAIMSRDSLISGLTGKDVAMMTLTSSGANAPFAHMFWDRSHNTWTLVAHNMPALKPGRTYQLWLVTSTAKISAGTFDSRNGDAMIRATYALSAADLKALAVTEEPMGGMPQPTSAPIIAVSAH